MSNDIFNKNYLTIKEFSELVGLSPSSLRHYDKIGIFQPAKRGNDFCNNYRYYSPVQLKSVNVIRVLTEIGVSIETIKELTQNRSPEKLLKLFRKNKNKLTEEIRFLQEADSVINIFTELLFEALSVSEFEITVSEMQERSLILGDVNDYDILIAGVRVCGRDCAHSRT